MGTPTTAVLYEAWHDGGFLVSEANGHRSRDRIMLAAGARCLAGTVLGKQTTTSATSAPGAANTGNGTLGGLAVTGTPAGGVYKVLFSSATEFAVSDPGHQAVGTGKAGTKFSGGGLEFKITAGATAFVAGDEFTVSVIAAGGLWAPWAPSATDGSQTVAGILFGTADATMHARSATAVTRSAEVNASELIWAPGATAEQIAAGKATLATLGIVVR